MTACRRRICTAETDGEPFCSERCERLYSPTRRRGPFDEAADHREQYNRARVINNDRGRR
jgi:hypothetical protein